MTSSELQSWRADFRSSTSVDFTKATHKKTSPGIDKHSIAGRLVLSRYFEPAMLFVTISNVLWLGILTDRSGQGDRTERDASLIIEQVYCCIFVMELTARILAYSPINGFVTDEINRLQNLFDFFLCFVYVFETTLATLRVDLYLPGVGGLRLMRILRVLRMSSQLRMMLKSMVAASISASMTFALVFIIMYVCSVVLTMWATRHIQVNPCSGITCPRVAFGSIPKSFITLMQVLCFDNTFSIIRATLGENVVYGLVIIGFIIIAPLTLLNILIGIVCQIVSQTTSSEMSKHVLDRADHVFSQLFPDNDGHMCIDDLKHHTAQECLNQVGFASDTIFAAIGLLELHDTRGDGVVSLSFVKDLLCKLHEPAGTQDIFTIKNNLEKLLMSCAELRGHLASESLTDGLTQASVHRHLLNLEQQLSRTVAEQQLVTSEPPVNTKSFGADTTDPVDVTLAELDKSLRRLRSRLKHCIKDCSAGNVAYVPPARRVVAKSRATSPQSTTHQAEYSPELHHACVEAIASLSSATSFISKAQ
eukprot:TRINITY_DN45952_c0_g1_i1.p1 TRINITY_DN45952_c0_g1~~TRINITY_DN45952_c0_g1_i1.p1  ORF type:complete len:533 (+),score=54.68 TRINITY_DN45952_c0_g1_i1:99-1697(+)